MYFDKYIDEAKEIETKSYSHQILLIKQKSGFTDFF